MLLHLLALACVVALWGQVSFCFDLTVLHTNDVHARIEQTNSRGGTCHDADAKAGKCYGGVARRLSAVNQLRASSSASLLLDAGDQFQGTVWFSIYKGSLTSMFMNQLGYDAMALGNHEFDNGVAGLLPFLRNVTFPIVAANMDTSAEDLWPTGNKLFTKSHVKIINGTKIGIIGHLTTSTVWLASPGKVTFEDEILAVKAEAARLKAQGVNILIAVGHAGIELDLALAKNVAFLDVVIGGHSNTFLYNGKPPSVEKPYGPYPLVVNPTDAPSKKVLVVQGYTYGKYLGNLKVKFDSQGEVVSYGGNPVLLNSSFAEDPDMLTVVNQFSGAVSNYSKQPIGRTHVLLNGDRMTCRVKECNMGNMIADAVIEMNRKTPDSTKWADVSIALINAGGIRGSVDKNITEQIYLGDMQTVLPFGNTADIVEITGATLLKTLEHSVTEYNPSSPAGRFLQVSGLRVKYDVSKPEGSRVVSVMVRCSACRIPSYTPLEPKATYKVLVPSFIADGGDKFLDLKAGILERHPGDTTLSLAMEYIRLETPVVAGLDDRIAFGSSSSKPCANSAAPSSSANSFMFALSCGLVALTRL